MNAEVHWSGNIDLNPAHI